MARPLKEGLDYFPLDVDIDQDDKIAMIEALHGAEGFAVVIKLLMKIYKEGYVYEWTKREQVLFSRRVNVDINSVEVIVNDCINEGLFNKNLYEQYNVLTSKGIQSRYLEAVKRRKEVNFCAKYFLITDVKSIVGSNKIDVFTVNEDGKRVNVNINPDSVEVNVNKSTQRKEKKRKELKDNAQIEESASSIESEFNEFWSIYLKKTDKKKAFDKFKLKRKKFSLEQILNGTKAYIAECERKGTEKQYIKGPAVFLNGENFNDEYEEGPKVNIRAKQYEEENFLERLERMKREAAEQGE